MSKLYLKKNRESDSIFKEKFKEMRQCFKEKEYQKAKEISEYLYNNYEGIIMDQVLAYKAVVHILLDEYDDAKILLYMLELFEQERGVYTVIMFDVYYNLAHISTIEKKFSEWNKYMLKAEAHAVLPSQKEILKLRRKKHFRNKGKFKGVGVEICK